MDTNFAHNIYGDRTLVNLLIHILMFRTISISISVLDAGICVEVYNRT